MADKKVRKFRNFLLQPLVQVKLGIYTIALTVLFSVVFGMQVYASFNGLYDLVLEVTELPDELGAMISDRIVSSTRWLIGIVGIYLAATIAITVLYTHRLVGPTIAFKRQIREMRKGNYDAQIILRKNDAFEDVAKELNELSTSLKSERS
jgi:nitrate/nitrite-specific signal transduction histidine kinase